MNNQPNRNWNDPLDQRFRVSDEPPVNPVVPSRPPPAAGPDGRRYNAQGDEYVNAELVPDDRPPYQRSPTPRKPPFVSPNPNISLNPNPVGWVWSGELNEWITEEEAGKNTAGLLIILAGSAVAVFALLVILPVLMRIR